jgi:hypothetical protein
MVYAACLKFELQFYIHSSHLVILSYIFFHGMRLNNIVLALKNSATLTS